MAKGIIKRYDFRKGFGFIEDDKNREDFFFHKSAWQGNRPIKKGLAVEFVTKESDKGPQAESVVPLENGSNVGKKAPVKVSSASSLEDRIASLEGSLNIWKILSILSLAGVIVLGIDRLL